MDNPLLVGMLHGLTQRHKHDEPFTNGQNTRIAEISDRNAVDEFHHEIRQASVRRPRVEHSGDVGVIHNRQRLTFCLKSRDDLR